MTFSNPPVELAIVVADMGGGGAQRVIVQLLSAWVAQGRRVALITYSNAPDSHPTPPGVKRVQLPPFPPSPTPFHAMAANLRRIFSLRRALRECGAPVVVGFILSTNVLLILAGLGLGMRVIISERNDPALQSMGLFWDALRWLFYRFAHKVTANTSGALKTMAAYVPAHKLALVPNPVAWPEELPGSREKIILHIGRLHPQKAQEILIRAFARTGLAREGWRLVIVGSGELLHLLKETAQTCQVAEEVLFPGWVADPWQQFRQAAFFALPSRHEGMPNVLLEAMSHGLPAIVSTASPGPLELVEEGVTGRVVASEDVAGLADALSELARNQELLEILGKNARLRAASHRLEAVLPVWETLLNLPPLKETP